MSVRSEARLTAAKETLRKALRYHPELNDRQIVWLMKTFQISSYMAIKARSALLADMQVKCVAKPNERGQLVKHWKLTII